MQIFLYFYIKYNLYKNKEPRGRILGAPKVAATYSPTTQCSTIGDAELNDPVSLPRPAPVRAASATRIRDGTHSGSASLLRL